MIVNKDHPLPADYVPKGLTEIRETRKDGRPMQKMVAEAVTALDELFETAKAENVDLSRLTVTSGYRSYEYQKTLFRLYRDRRIANGMTFEEADRDVRRTVALPGQSEHQSGLCVDMHTCPSASNAFAETPEYHWLTENAHRFGFILRYPEGKEAVTGYAFESWHWRYVGKETAARLHATGDCLDEYVNSFLPRRRCNPENATPR